MKLFRSTLYVLTTLLALHGSVQAAAIQGLYNTGVGVDNNTPATPGDLDAHYSLVSSPDGSSAIVAILHPYIAPAANSQYIGPSGNLNQPLAAGLYVYQTTFNLTGLIAATASISGTLLADDDVQVFLNGNFTGIGILTAFQAHNPFTINSGFIAGLNTLEFRVDNSNGGGTGLGVSMAGTADVDTSSGVPEPNTVVLVASIVGGLLIARRR